MNIWLVTIGEPLPCEPGRPRLLRAGLLAERLADAGHEVLWWTSAFDHFRKVWHAAGEPRIPIRPGFCLQLLRGMGYRRNFSLARIRDHRALARRFAALAVMEPRPDVILASFPSIELAREASRHGARHGIPVVLDVRDLWPDIFLAAVPVPVSGLARGLLSPLFRQTREAFHLARAVTGITPPFVAWGLRQAGRLPGPLDRDFPMGYPSRPLPAAELQAARDWWRREHGLVAGTGFTVVFSGSFGHQVDLATLIEAARRLRDAGIHFLLCGDGENLAACRARAAGLENVVLPGWVDAPRIRTAMEMAHVGLAPYFSREDFLNSYPNKVLEYLAHGVPVWSAMDGLVGALLREHRCGEVYGPDNSLERLVGSLLALRDEPERRQAMSGRAYALFKARFEAEKVYAGMIDYLAEVAGA